MHHMGQINMPLFLCLSRISIINHYMMSVTAFSHTSISHTFRNLEALLIAKRFPVVVFFFFCESDHLAQFASKNGLFYLLIIIYITNH